MFRHVFVLAMIAVVVLAGATVATACCWGWGGGCYGGGCYGGGCYSGGYGGGCYGGGCYGGGCYGGGYSYSCYGGHCYAPAAPAHHHAAVSADRGRLVVSLPADATLLVDGQRTATTSAQRTFVTPQIETGRTYFYTLTAEVNRNGVTRSVTEKVYIRPGETTQVSLTIADVDTGVAAR